MEEEESSKEEGMPWLAIIAVVIMIVVILIVLSLIGLGKSIEEPAFQGIVDYINKFTAMG